MKKFFILICLLFLLSNMALAQNKYKVRALPTGSKIQAEIQSGKSNKDNDPLALFSNDKNVIVNKIYYSNTRKKYYTKLNDKWYELTELKNE